MTNSVVVDSSSKASASWQQKLCVPPSSPQKRNRGASSLVQMKSAPSTLLKSRFSMSMPSQTGTKVPAASGHDDIVNILDECEKICLTTPLPSETRKTSVVDKHASAGDVHFTTASWTIESTLIRDLGICFIDARRLSTEAKLKLGVKGYPSVETKLKCVELAIEIFNAKSSQERNALRQMKVGLDSAKQEVNVAIPENTIKAFGGGSNKKVTRASAASTAKSSTSSSNNSNSNANGRRRRSAFFLRDFKSPLA